MNKKKEEPEAKPNGTEIVLVQDASVLLMPTMNIAAAKARLKEFQDFVKEYLGEGEDYGRIPGTDKPTLFKSGADKLCEVYGLADDYLIEARTEDYAGNPPLFDYTIKCSLTSRRDGRLVGTGFGSCNSWEGKYRFREARRKCPLCHQETIIKGQEQYGGGWVCWKKKGGCGGKFLDDDEAIVSQAAGKEINDDVPTLKNTILKMAKKRAKIDAVIAVTRSSGIFTQDLEDLDRQGPETGQGTRASAKRVIERKTKEAGKPPKKMASSVLFYVEPPEHHGHFAEFVNLKEYAAGLDETAQDGLRNLFRPYIARITSADTVLVSTGKDKLGALLQKLAGDAGITVKKLEAPDAAQQK